jgi:hypothetical protein
MKNVVRAIVGYSKYTAYIILPPQDCNYIVIMSFSGSKLEISRNRPDGLPGRVMFVPEDERVSWFPDVRSEDSSTDG